MGSSPRTVAQNKARTTTDIKMVDAEAVKKICDIYDWDGKGELDLFFLGDVMYALGMNTTKKVCVGLSCIRSSRYAQPAGSWSQRPPSCEDPGETCRCRSSQGRTCCSRSHQRGGKREQGRSWAQLPSCGSHNRNSGTSPHTGCHHRHRHHRSSCTGWAQPPSCEDPGCSCRCKSSRDRTCCSRSLQRGGKRGQGCSRRWTSCQDGQISGHRHRHCSR